MVAVQRFAFSRTPTNMPKFPPVAVLMFFAACTPAPSSVGAATRTLTWSGEPSTPLRMLDEGQTQDLCDGVVSTYDRDFAEKDLCMLNTFGAVDGSQACVAFDRCMNEVATVSDDAWDELLPVTCMPNDAFRTCNVTVQTFVDCHNDELAFGRAWECQQANDVPKASPACTQLDDACPDLDLFADDSESEGT